ncbi:germination protein YpeB [Zongyangia hominis]|uniref:Germination protein YpeB n=1 Tax=Zongyangia hominis TaxID=2763677 RepID=A0A926IAT9_9FIRM|nr:germination protein YpeB [Zongyangia hominis]MBC8570556.1 germination protein YpeB [Zongyangia hominis]
MKRRTMIRIISYLSALFLVLGIGAFRGNYEAMQYRRALESGYRGALDELTSTLGNIENTLLKGIYVGSPTQISMVAAQLWKDAASAKSCLSSLPVGEMHLENTYRFLSQVGDFSMALSKKSMNGQQLSSDERDNFESMVDYAASLENELMGLDDYINTNNASLGDIVQAANENSDDPGVASVNAGFEQMEEGFTSYPKLIYDGPFSDHLADRTPVMTQGQSSISRAAAHKKAAAAAMVEADTLTDASDENSHMPLYCFSGQNVEVGVTKQGGYLCYMRQSRPVGDPVKTVKEAFAAAHQYLNSVGLSGMKDSYYEIGGGICTMNFSAVQDDVVCYPDLVKVGVALDTGDVVFYEARGYLMNHKEREIPTGILSKDRAQQVLSSRLEVQSVQMAIIPTDGKNEIYCYEFLCEGRNGQKVLVYVNARTGAEEQVLILLESENGVLTV